MQKLTDSELLLLGLVAEMPRHGYELEQLIEKRDMRRWTSIGFSSIYFLLGKLEKKGLVQSQAPAAAKARKKFELTKSGRDALVDETVAALTTVQQNRSSLLMGMLHWPVLSREQALDALRQREANANAELEQLASIHFEQQPLPDYVDSMFEFASGQLQAELLWIEETLEYMKNKVWMD